MHWSGEGLPRYRLRRMLLAVHGTLHQPLAAVNCALVARVHHSPPLLHQPHPPQTPLRTLALPLAWSACSPMWLYWTLVPHSSLALVVCLLGLVPHPCRFRENR